MDVAHGSLEVHPLLQSFELSPVNLTTYIVFRCSAPKILHIQDASFFCVKKPEILLICVFFVVKAAPKRICLR